MKEMKATQKYDCIFELPHPPQTSLWNQHLEQEKRRKTVCFKDVYFLHVKRKLFSGLQNILVSLTLF